MNTTTTKPFLRQSNLFAVHVFSIQFVFCKTVIKYERASSILMSKLYLHALWGPQKHRDLWDYASVYFLPYY